MPKGMVTAFFLGIAVKKECIVNAFNILSTSKRLTSRVLPLVENEVFFKKCKKKTEKAFVFPVFHFT